MFINNSTIRTPQSTTQKDCICTLFPDNRIVSRKQWKEGQQSVRSYNNTPKSEVNIVQTSKQSKKISLSSFIRERKETEHRSKEINPRENYQKQEKLVHENIQKISYLKNNNYIPTKNIQYQVKVQQKYTPQILSAAQSSAYLETITVPRSSIYHRKPILQAVQQQSYRQVITQTQPFTPNHVQFYTNLSHTDFHSSDKQYFNKSNILKNQVNTKQIPRLSLSERYNIKISQPITQELQSHETQAIIQSKMSKEAGLSTQSTNVNKESKNFSYFKQSSTCYSPYHQQGNNFSKDGFIPFISEIEPIDKIVPEMAPLSKFRSIESINNTQHDLESLNVSVVLDKPYKFARLQLHHGQKRASNEKQKQGDISIEFQKQKWKQFEDYLPEIDQSERQPYF